MNSRRGRPRPGKSGRPIPPSKRPRPPGEPANRPTSLPRHAERGHRSPVASSADAPPSSMPQVAAPRVLAESASWAAGLALQAVLGAGRRLDRVVAEALRGRRDLAAPDARFVSAALASMFRWRGWVSTTFPDSVAGQLLLSHLLDASEVHPACRIWAREVGIDPGRLVPLADAPSWTAKTDGYKRLVTGLPTVVDPWRLFPDWFRKVVSLPPGDESAKVRAVALIEALQRPPQRWVRLQGPDPSRAWEALRGQGVRPWQHRRLERAGRLDPDVDLAALRLPGGGSIVPQDLAGQVVGLACDPEPGERWWVTHAASGGHVHQVAELLKGKGVLVATDPRPRRLQSVKLQARRSPGSHLQVREWDGRHVPGKSGTFSGVLVAPPCSALGTWRRHPDDRWTSDPDAIPRFAAEQAQALRVAALGVKPGGALIYAVTTLTEPETSEVARLFVETHPEFRFDRFAHPLDGTIVEGSFRLWPHDHDSDAVYVARFIRSHSQPSHPPKKSSPAETPPEAQISPETAIHQPPEEPVTYPDSQAPGPDSR